MMQRTIILTAFWVAFWGNLPAFSQTDDQSRKAAEHAAENLNKQKEARAKYAGVRREINADLEMLAKGLAESLSDPHLRNFLRKEIRESNKREKILRLDQFAGKAARATDVPATAKANGRLNEVQAAKRKLSDRRYLQLFGTNEVDIYFPVPEHREQWRGNDDLLVAFSPTEDESEVTGIVAYSAKNGQRVILDSRRAPATPILMVTVSEHDRLDAEVAPRSLEPLPPNDPPKESPDPPGSEGQYKGGNSYLHMRHLKILDDKEPWYKGDPEIYAVCLQWAGTKPASNNKRDLWMINETNRFYYVWQDAGWFFDTTYSDGALIAIWERDGTSWIHDLFAGVAIAVVGYFVPGSGYILNLAWQVYKVADGDDFICEREFSKSYVPWVPCGEYYYRYLYSAGYMYLGKMH